MHIAPPPSLHVVNAYVGVSAGANVSVAVDAVRCRATRRGEARCVVWCFGVCAVVAAVDVWMGQASDPA